MADNQQATTGTENTIGTQMASAPNPPSTQPSVPGSIEVSGGGAAASANPSEAPTQESIQEGGKKTKSTRVASAAWLHFKKEGNVATCNYCGKTYACNSGSHGTTNLNKHLKCCPKNPNREFDKKQKTIAFGKQSEDDPVTMKVVEFSQERCRTELAKMLVVDELPFKFVENMGFRGFIAATQPRFQIPSRRTIARDCMQLYVEEKVKLKSVLSLNHQMVSLTTDTWTSIQKMNYMCVTAHYIDDGWVLHKKILSFALIPDHKGETIGKALEKCLKDWGINKIGTITVDNASANNTALAYLVRSLSHWNGISILNGEYMHLRCCAHILNLIVCDGMKELDCSISRIRTSCKYVRSSPARLATFRRCAQEANLPINQMLVLDVPTRWNSTFLMLEVAEKFEKAFARLEYDDSLYVSALDIDGGPPNSDDWARVRNFITFLKVFHDSTLAFSGSLQVTSNNFVHQLCLILNTLNEWMRSGDFGMQRMATNMKIKFDKYWDINGNINHLLFVAVFLDPRYKWEYIEFCLSELYDVDKYTEILVKLKDVIKSLFAQYTSLYPLPLDNSSEFSCSSMDVTSQSQSSSQTVSGNVTANTKDKFRLKVKRKQGELKKNELERYMEDEVEDEGDQFDILKWWGVKATRYHVLSHMARDILAIPVSTVSSEAAFSTGGRVLDPYRSSLHPTSVEALICTQNWLKLGNMVDLQGQDEEVTEIETVLSEIEGQGGV